LHQNGAAAVIVRQGTNGVSGDGSYTLDPTQTEAFQQLLTAIPDSLHGVVYLWGADLPPGTDMATDELEAGQRAALGGLLHLAQAMAASRRSARIWIVSRGAQSVHGEETELAPTQATLWGLGRVIREEHPDLWGGLLDLDPDTAADSVEAIWNEIGSTDGEDQLAYRAGGRYALRLVRAESTPPPQPYRFRKDGTYLITGGLGDIGSRIARRMAEQGASRFILMGRTPLPPRSQWRNTPPESERGKKIALVRDLEAAGASVHLAPIDVADESALCAYLEAFEAEGWPPVVGVIHAAGLLDVHLLQQMDWPTMSRVLRPKVLGGLLLHRYLPHVELFVNFSSINALLGLPGQGNYAAANAFLDGLAAYGRAHSRQDLSINWSVWEGLGFASTTSGAGSSAQLAEQGILGFTGEQGVEAFGGLLNWPGANVTVLPADWQKYKLSRSGARQFPMLKHLLDDTAAPRRESVKAGASVVEQLAATEPDKRLDAMGEYLQQVIAQVLKKPSAKVKRTEPLGSYGMNSLMGMELRNRLERDLGITLSATLVWNYPTIDLMSGFLAEKLGLAVDVPAEAASAAETADTPPLDDLIAGLQTLSDDDILRELTGKS
jgi:acyl carrier protein